MSHVNTQKSIVDHIKATITGLKDGLKSYPIRDLVKDAEKFGPYLKQQRLETNQVRKFLDAINQIKALLAQQDEDKNLQLQLEAIQKKAEQKKQDVTKNSSISGEDLNEKVQAIQKGVDDEKDKLIFATIEADIVLLKPKLAYAAARQRSAKPLEEVMSVAIDKVESTKDFERLVQLIESIIAYHKAEGGK
jgi:CRISPR-associated protein Csm2